MSHIAGKKVKMGQVFREENVVPVTFVKLDDKEADFAVGEKVKISGKSKGRGFQGVVKRHRFHGSPKTHGTKHTHRTGGSIGATGPQRVLPGQKMPGRMGQDKINLTKVEVMGYEKERGLLILKGSLPGMNKASIKIFKLEEKKEEVKK